MQGDQAQQEAWKRCAFTQIGPSRRTDRTPKGHFRETCGGHGASGRRQELNGVRSVHRSGIDGLLHIRDIAWGRVSHPSLVLSVGQQVPVKVLKLDRERQRISLGYKQLNPDPWLSLPERYAVGSKVHGKVANLTDYGVFLEIEEGVEGLIHVSELSWSRRTKSPLKLYSEGELLEAVILGIDLKERRLSLGVKQLRPDPWTTLAETFSLGSLVQGTVRNLTDFGAFIEVAEGIDGLVHVSDLSWSRRIKHPSEIVRKGQQVSAVVLQVDPVDRRLSLGIKQLQPDAWELFFSSHQVGEIVKGTITHLTSFGVFVELVGGIEGLCHHSQIEPPSASSGPLSTGDVRDFQIIRLLAKERKIGLSLKIGKSQQLPEKSAADTVKPAAQAATSGGGSARS
jgi:small subunit ribosomal protein S1